jgi:hypothetical protein
MDREKEIEKKREEEIDREGEGRKEWHRGGRGQYVSSIEEVRGEAGYDPLLRKVPVLSRLLERMHSNVRFLGPGHESLWRLHSAVL